MNFTQYYEVKKALKNTLKDAKTYKKMAMRNELCGMNEYMEAKTRCKSASNPDAWVESVRKSVKENYIAKAELYYTYAAEEYAYAARDAQILKQSPATIQKYIDAKEECVTKAHDMKVMLAESQYVYAPAKNTK